MQILLIEDSMEIVKGVSLTFKLRWPDAAILCAETGREGIKKLETTFPDIVILDINLPDITGFEVLEEIRNFSNVPIIILTIRGDEMDKLRGLENGADDYMVKPFSPRELVARVKAVLRRGREPEQKAVRSIGTLEVDEGKHQVRLQGRPIELTIKEFDLLCALMQAKGRVLNREQILESVWGYSNAVDIESRTVDVHIRRLREKLGKEHKRIVTVKGVGYRFEAESV